MSQFSGVFTLTQASQAIKAQNWPNAVTPDIEYLVVAGGGGASCSGGGAGGGGRYFYFCCGSTFYRNYLSVLLFLVSCIIYILTFL